MLCHISHEASRLRSRERLVNDAVFNYRTARLKATVGMYVRFCTSGSFLYERPFYLFIFYSDGQRASKYRKSHLIFFPDVVTTFYSISKKSSKSIRSYTRNAYYRNQAIVRYIVFRESLAVDKNWSSVPFETYNMPWGQKSKFICCHADMTGIDTVAATLIRVVAIIAYSKQAKSSSEGMIIYGWCFWNRRQAKYVPDQKNRLLFRWYVIICIICWDISLPLDKFPIFTYTRSVYSNKNRVLGYDHIFSIRLLLFKFIKNYSTRDQIDVRTESEFTPSNELCQGRLRDIQIRTYLLICKLRIFCRPMKALLKWLLV